MVAMSGQLIKLGLQPTSFHKDLQSGAIDPYLRDPSTSTPLSESTHQQDKVTPLISLIHCSGRYFPERGSHCGGLFSSKSAKD